MLLRPPTAACRSIIGTLNDKAFKNSPRKLCLQRRRRRHSTLCDKFVVFGDEERNKTFVYCFAAPACPQRVYTESRRMQTISSSCLRPALMELHCAV